MPFLYARVQLYGLRRKIMIKKIGMTRNQLYAILWCAQAKVDSYEKLFSYAIFYLHGAFRMVTPHINEKTLYSNTLSLTTMVANGVSNQERIE